jgi:hypothetical protein
VQWGAYLANESTNNYVGWFDASSAPLKAAGSILEGAINIRNEFGYLPTKLYIALGQYATPDNGVLQKQVPDGNANGDIEASEFFVFDYTISGTNEQTPVLPAAIELFQNFPNPFNPVTMIQYSIPQSGDVRLSVYDMLGKEVAVLVNGRMEMGVHYARFDGSPFASGVYLYKLSAGSKSVTRKLLLMK